MKSENLFRNDCGRWQFSDYELISGSLVEISIDGNWILGVIEHWKDDYYWFSKRDGISVILHSGIHARSPRKGGQKP